MRKVLTKEMVEKSINDAKACGKKITLATLHAALGQRGSMSTLVRLKAELEASAHLPTDSEDGLRTFREVWSLAKDEGRKEIEATMADLKKDIEVLAQENERLDGASTAAANQMEDLMLGKSEIETELAGVRSLLAKKQESLFRAGEATRAALERLAAEQDSHQNTRLELAKAVLRGHDFELELVKCHTVLDTQKARINN
jgi:predicted  nucleic acid-binding Zn-ribbon protein